GFTRAKNAAHTITMNFMVYGIAMLAYWAVGFALQAGGVGSLGTLGGYDKLAHEVSLTIGGKDWGLFGGTGFFLTGVAYVAPVFAYFLFQMVFMDTAATIPTGALAERWKFAAFAVFRDRKSTRLNSSHVSISYAVFCLKKKTFRNAA